MSGGGGGKPLLAMTGLGANADAETGVVTGTAAAGGLVFLTTTVGTGWALASLAGLATAFGNGLTADFGIAFDVGFTAD